MRLVELENWVLGLEDKCVRTMDELREMRNREARAALLFREMNSVLAATEKGESESDLAHSTQARCGAANCVCTICTLSPFFEAPGPSIWANDELSPRVMRLYQLYDQLILPNPSYSNMQGAMPFQPMYAAQRAGMSMSLQGGASHFSPQIDGSGSRTSGEGLPPAGPKIPWQGPAFGGGMGGQAGRGVSGATGGGGKGITEDIIELPKIQQAIYNGGTMDMTPMFVEMPAWLAESTTARLPVYHRKSSYGTTVRPMVKALAGQPVGRFDETQDPLDTGSTQTTSFDRTTSMASSGIQNRNGGPSAAGSNAGMTGPSGLAVPSIQKSLLGALIIPPEASGLTSNDPTGREGRNPVETVRLRRSTTIRPQWNKAPRILVVDDDLMYRQLLSKFLKEFGCVTDTVDNAQNATDKMNRTKYDLVLMDIFFGPSIEGQVGRPESERGVVSLDDNLLTPNLQAQSDQYHTKVRHVHPSYLHDEPCPTS
jgi:osomolarity two-component system response regulator SKN7